MSDWDSQSVAEHQELGIMTMNFHTIESEEDVWPNKMGNPRLLEQLGLKTMNLAIVLRFQEDVFKSAFSKRFFKIYPFSCLGNFQHMQAPIRVTRPDTVFTLFLLHFQSIEVISLPWRQKLTFYWHQTLWLAAALIGKERLCCWIFLSPLRLKYRTDLALGSCNINFFV